MKQYKYFGRLLIADYIILSTFNSLILDRIKHLLNTGMSEWLCLRMHVYKNLNSYYYFLKCMKSRSQHALRESTQVSAEKQSTSDGYSEWYHNLTALLVIINFFFSIFRGFLWTVFRTSVCVKSVNIDLYCSIKDVWAV